MGKAASAAIFHTGLGILKITSTPVFQCIKRTITEQTIKVLRVLRIVTGKVFTFFMGKKGKFLFLPGILIQHFLSF